MQLDVDKFVDITFREGVISTLIGLPEGGKSNLACTFMEMLVARGYNVYTNIGFFDLEDVAEAMERKKLAYVKEWKKWYRQKPPEVHTIRSLSDLFIGVLSTEPNVVVLDEGGIHISSKRATGKEAVNWEYIAYIVRHLSSALLLVAQAKGSITPTLRETLAQIEMKVRKLNYRNRMFTIGTAVEVIDKFTGEALIKFEVAEGDEFHFIQKTRYPYDGKDFPYFDMNLDLKEVFKRLSTDDDGTPISSLKVRHKVPGTDMTLGESIIRELILEGNVGSRNSSKSKYLKKTEYQKKYNLSQKTVDEMCESGRCKFFTTDGRHIRILDLPPEDKRPID